jgi:cholesterol 7-dehydrogenase
LQDLSGVGYDHLLKDSGLSLAQRKGRTKRQLVQEIRRLRKVGNLPPVYPNGWFSLLESTELAPGEVKHVPALGNQQNGWSIDAYFELLGNFKLCLTCSLILYSADH